MKKIIAVILSALLLLSVLPVSSLAAYRNDGTIGDIFVDYVYSEDGVMTKRVYDENGNPVKLESSTLGTASTSLPSSYDARTTNRVTSVKNQNPFGTCWTFAFCSAAESSLISQGYESTTSVDLSEAHLAWFRAANYVEGSSIPVQQDRKIITPGETTFSDGGNSFDAAATVARWSGLATEAQFPYSTNETNMHFSQSSMFVNNYNLTSMVVYDVSTETDSIKQAIIKNGALATAIYYTDSAVKKTSTYCTHYQNVQTGTNHAITCVGWDDNYPASNFVKTPPANGAWLIKNSWGTSMNDGGYFWLSYYDTSIGEFSEVNVKPAGDYDNNYQYDGCFVGAATGYAGKAYGANVFTAEGSEKVKGCGFYTIDNAPYTCTAMLYTGLSNASNPSSGTLRESKSINVNHQGYYTIDFNNEYSISAGEKFAIVIKYQNASSSEGAWIPYENLSNQTYSYTVSAGQSFYSGSGSSWNDCKTNSRGNIPIKAFTVDSNPIVVSSISIEKKPTKLSYFSSESLDLTGLQVRAYYGDGTSAIVPAEELSVSGYSPSQTGTQTITVSYGGKTAAFNISVTAVVETGIAINTLPNKMTYLVGEDFDYTGLSIKLLYNDGTYITKTGGFRMSYYPFSSAGFKTVTVMYGDFTATFNVNVIKEDAKAISAASGCDYVSVDNNERLICLSRTGITDIAGCINCRSGYTYTCGSVGTGSEVKVYKNSQLVEIYTVAVYGDLNGDNWANGMDSVLINWYINGIFSKGDVGAAKWRAADVTSDGDIDVSDKEIIEDAGLLYSDNFLTMSEEELVLCSEYQEYIEVLTQSIEPAEKTETVSFFKMIIEFIISLFKSIFLK